MIILDHNLSQDQVEQLRRWKLHCEQIGFQVGRPEDQQGILRYLHRAKSATFFTRDDDFFRARLCHANYCLVFVDVLETERHHSSGAFSVILLSKPKLNAVVK